MVTVVQFKRPRMRERPMVKAEQQMPGHVTAAYRDALDNILFLKRQQWLATTYVLLLYVAIFVISARFFSRTDLPEIGLAYLQLLRLLYTGGCCIYFNAQLRSSEIACFGSTRPISAKRSARDWISGWNEGHIGMSPRFTFVSWLFHWWELS